MARKLKAVAAKIGKFFACVPGVVWVHLLTLFLMCTVGGLIVAMFANPEFAKQVFGLLIVLAFLGFVLYLGFQLYRMIFEFICDFIDEWDRR